MSWNRIEGRPPAAFHGTLVWSSRRERMLLVAIDDDTQCLDVWGLSASGWRKEETGLLPMPAGSRGYDPALAWAEPDGSVVVARVVPGGVLLTTLGEEGSSILTVDLPEGGDRPSAAWDPSAGHVVLCVPVSNESRVYSIDRRAGTIEALPDAPRLDRITSGPSSLFGIGTDRARGWCVVLYERDRSGRWEKIGEPGGLSDGLAWYAPGGGVAGFLPANDSVMRLRVWTGSSFDPRPEIEMPFTNGGALATSPRGQVVFFGGQDFDAGGSNSNDTWANQPDGRGAPKKLEGNIPPLGRYDTLFTVSDRLAVANHGSCAVLAASDEGWLPLVAGIPRAARNQESGRFDDRQENFAAWGDEVWMLDASGGLWHARHGGEWSPLEVDGEDGPEGYYSRRVAMAWDPLGERLVLQGGQKADGWAYRPADNRWTELEGQKPKRGYGPAVSTPQGVFALIGRRLWHLAGDDWTQVGKKTIDGSALLFDAKQTRLVVVGRKGVFAIGEKGEPLPVADAPGRIEEETPIGLDPAGDRIVTYGRRGNGCEALSLTELELGSGLPIVGRAGPSRKKMARAEKKEAPRTAVRRFELIADGSSKFWEIAVQGAEHTVRYGKIGAKGQSKSKSFADAEAAQKDAEKLIRQKTKKGYLEIEAAEATPEGPELPESAAAQLELVIERLRAIPMGDDEEDDEYTALRWEAESYDTLGEGATARKKKLDAWEKKHLPIPVDLREFIERWGTPTIDGNVFGVNVQLRVDLGAWDLLRVSETSYTIRDDEGRLFVRGDAVGPRIVFDDGCHSSVLPLPVGPSEAISWVAFGQDASSPDGVHFGPLAPTFGDAVIGMALGLTDAIFMPKGRPRTRLEKRIATELDDTMKAVALAWLDRYEAHAEALTACDDTYDRDIELREDDATGTSVILLVADEVPGAAEVAMKAKHPELAKVPFVFDGGEAKVEKALSVLPDDTEYDDAYLAAGDKVAKHLFDYLVGAGGCPVDYSYWPCATKDDVRAALRKKKIDIRELENGSTAALYTLGVGARAALRRVAALRKRLR